MGKRSSFARIERDYYPTPYPAVAPLLPWLSKKERFCEPCAGDGRLVKYLTDAGHTCAAAWDIEPRGRGIDRQDARSRQIGNITSFITNPPWSRPVLHAIIDNLSAQYPTWLLFDADWIHTRQAAPYWPRCSMVISVGRLKWIENSPHTGKDNCCWYRFDPDYTGGPRFIGRDFEPTQWQKVGIPFTHVASMAGV
jgi:hypothetical protein